MISANELRIGNWIYDKQKDQYVELTGIVETNQEIWVSYANGSSIYKTTIWNVEPIPLTEEILLKCGFELNKEKTLFETDSCGIRLMNISNLYFKANFPIKSDIVHLHQLQNLFFALIGQELQVKF